MSELKVNLRPAWRNYWMSLSIAGILLLTAFGMLISDGESEGKAMGFGLFLFFFLILMAFIVIKRFSWKFTIDGNRVTRHHGIISRNQQSVRIKDLRSVELGQSLFQRIFGIGDLTFYSAGSASAEVKFFGIKDPLKWRDIIDNAMDDLKDSNE